MLPRTTGRRGPVYSPARPAPERQPEAQQAPAGRPKRYALLFSWMDIYYFCLTQAAFYLFMRHLTCYPFLK
jgi:hypothetical protein